MKQLSDYISESVSVNERQFKPKNGYKFIDLGLSSGTLWTDDNEEGYYTFDEAVEKYDNSLPTREQWEELKDECKWKWMGNGYKVTGPNGNSITLSAAGGRDCGERMNRVGSAGYYWSSSPNGLYCSWSINFNSGSVTVKGSVDRDYGFSVRLVK